MNPYDEERIRDEVIYLHSLWHQGPPPPPPPQQPLLHRYPFAPSHTRSLPPLTTTAFKKNKKKWPCPISSHSPLTGWPVPKPRSAPPPLQPQEKERLSALQAQNKASKALKEFLSGSASDDEEEDDNDEEDSEGRLVEFEEFFIRVFMEDNELMGYYQRCFENGEFCCWVCDAGKKSGKKYKDCVGLVQHSISILRTANKKAHRAFGQAVCKVFGWDIHRLPTIVITGEPLRCSTEGNPKKSVADNEDGKDGSSKTEDIAVSLEHVEDSIEEHVKEADQSIGECSSKEGDIDAKVMDIGLENGGAKFEDHEGVGKSIGEVINL